jgi:hypothetical protein
LWGCLRGCLIVMFIICYVDVLRIVGEV